MNKFKIFSYSDIDKDERKSNYLTFYDKVNEFICENKILNIEYKFNTDRIEGQNIISTSDVYIVYIIEYEIFK